MSPRWAEEPIKNKKNPPSQFQGPVLFVNHGVGNLTSEPHRHEVFTHVQNNYRRWRRREDAKSIRAGVRLPTTLAPSSQGLTSRSRLLAHDTSSSSKLENRAKEKQRILDLEAALEQSNSPLSLVKRGNSDPFFDLYIRSRPAD